jgi:hypothetical protein
LKKVKIVSGAKNCALSLDATRYLNTRRYLELVVKCLQCEIWGASILYCAMALESYLREELDVNDPIGTHQLVKRTSFLWKKKQIEIAKCVFALRDAHAHPYWWLFEKTKNRLRSCGSIFGQTRPEWFKELSKKAKARTSKKILMLDDQKTAYAVAEQTIRLICPNLLLNNVHTSEQLPSL